MIPRHRIARTGTFLLALAALLLCPAARAEAAPVYGLDLEGFDYPFPVAFFDIADGDATYRMAYMDVRPEGEARGTVVLMHGKNFCGAYWGPTAKDLAAQGFRVVIPDQLGFGKSSKPVGYTYSFDGLAENTHALLESLGVEGAVILGHSMGGMLASRYALNYPDATTKLVLLNPIGLEDWAEKGVPYRGIEAWYERALATSYDKIRKYQEENYYQGNWKPEYDRWVELLVGMTRSEDYPQMARVQALTYDMIYKEPVVHAFPEIEAETLLIIGQADRTALGKDLVSEELKQQLGDYPALGRAAAEAIPQATLVEIEDVGHLPHIQAYDRFIGPLLAFVKDEAVPGAR